MDLYFMRHGIAEIQDESGISSDAERPLTPKGIKRMRKAAKGLLNLEISFDRILTSPLLRARQSADIVAEVLKMGDRVEEISELAAGGSVQDLLSRLGKYRESKGLLLVGHQPLLGETASFLLCKEKGVKLDLKKGGLCYIEMEDLPLEGSAVLHWLLTPKQLRRLAGS